MSLPASSAIHHAIAPEAGSRTAGSVRRARRALASTPARYRRSRNAPHRRSLRANRLYVSGVRVGVIGGARGMTYATLDMLKGAFGEANLISATDRSGTGSIDVSAVERALSGADATIDAALAVRYRLPLAVVPTIVSEIAVSIALYKLHVFAPDQKVKDDHDRR
ncbi:DUF1320 domain-containing protein [Sphingomonas paucimobilis]|uniref:DUF1320 domain-containing protein n=1 Tax=Sphingomonas paucimobilis TaxID=13689 RepID=UPI001962B219|nr:DUF1320 domain-containing protein [Sphingomonas paucimobilis]QRY97086.1 DUF1320 domain-containing protein [Sphingomonas paucimobilis]